MFLIYKITNTINGKYYIGAHKTDNVFDSYMGSGVLIKRAIRKHGKQNFQKEILFVFNSEEEMFEKERELVNEETVYDKNCYNQNTGGTGSTYLLQQWRWQKNSNLAKEASRKGIEKQKELAATNPEWVACRSHKMSIRATERNSMHGRIHISRELEKKRILKVEYPKYKAQGWISAEDRTNALTKRWINDGECNTIVNKSELVSYLEKGWKLGRLNKR